VNPRFEFIKQPCETCGGSGRLTMKHPKGFYTCTQAHRRRPSCGDCLGKGYLEIRRKRLDTGVDSTSTLSRPHGHSRFCAIHTVGDCTCTLASQLSGGENG
jgi:hypothetical protein